MPSRVGGHRPRVENGQQQTDSRDLSTAQRCGHNAVVYRLQGCIHTGKRRDIMRGRGTVAGWTLAFACLCAAIAVHAQNSGPEHFTAFAVDLSNTAPRNNTTTVDIVVNRYSTDAERDRILEALDQGQDKLLDVLQHLPVVGYMTTPGSLRYDIHFARQRAGEDGGRNIYLMTDRRIGMWEAVNRPRTIDYPFTLIQLQLDKSGKGVGKASIATKITKTSKNMIELENFSSQPVQLNEVKKIK
jgi:hypothetical protein